MGKIFKILAGLFLLGCLFAVYVGGNIIYFGLKSAPQKSDAVMVLGCRIYGETPSPFLIGRIDRALELYNEGFGRYIIVTGGMGPGEAITESEASKRYLISKGISEDKIIMEDKSTSTMENLIYSKEKIKENNIGSVVIVSNKYHLKRASLMAKKVGINASFSGVFLSRHKSYEISGFFREILALGKFYVFDR